MASKSPVGSADWRQSGGNVLKLLQDSAYLQPIVRTPSTIPLFLNEREDAENSNTEEGGNHAFAGPDERI